MTKFRRYETVVLLESLGSFSKGEKGAIVEVYTGPYEAYDIEIITDNGETLGLLEGVKPDYIAPMIHLRPVFTTIEVEEGGTRAKVTFSDGAELTVNASELYSRAG